MGRTGWWLLAAVSGLLLAGTALGGVVVGWAAVVDRDAFALLRIAVAAGFGVLFWRWILLGAWLRIRPPDGIDPAVADPVGPWGVVGRVLLALLVVGFVGGGVWASLAGDRAIERAEEARDAAVRAAKDRGLTVDDVTAAQGAAAIWATDPSGPDPLSTLLDVPGAEVVDVAANGDEASILLRTDDSPPCAVVDIVQGDLIRGRLTDRC